MNHVYKVPVIPQNLSKQETIIQVAEVLNHLSNVTDDILTHISNRVDKSRKKLTDISERVDKVNMKINKLTGAKKATQVFSSCKYPGTDVSHQYISIFSEVKPPELIRHKVKHKKITLNEEPLEKLHVYHVKVKKNDNKEHVRGLGDIPNDIDCVNDLLLYNSGKNLYKNFVMSDALEISQQIKEQVYNDSASIGAAPYSISERSTLTRSSTQTYFYTPNLGEVPALDVPLDLPDLPNIADDLRYDTELGPGIAPSVTTTPNIPDLPIIEPTEPNKENSPEIELPPPPPIKGTLENEEIQLTKSVAIEIKTPEPPTHPVKEETSPTKLSEFPQINMRASLMEAIRKAGGTKNLKSATMVKNEKSTKSASGGDLMADLHAKLSMRRKGISGTKKQDNSMDASTALEKISAMIPPPVNEINENNTEDEDWDD
ncbi:WAS protein family -like 1 [Asbolus verrucosus]|uniref:WAS protein family-like 1 n=1 Tax=Asbolus verrucosus TaxID=1661398 RepID=A0A482W2D7_ASBVE|nr:WAS protein family -like 1 [Asbolus verrucosus]